MHIPLLLTGALVYSAISVVLAMKFNPKLKRVEILEQKAEASFRHKLYGCLSPAGLIGANKACLMAARTRMSYRLFTKFQLAVMTILPYIALIPALLDGNLTLGELVRHSSTFGLIVVNASILISLYPLWVKSIASKIRVSELFKK